MSNYQVFSVIPNKSSVCLQKFNNEDELESYLYEAKYQLTKKIEANGGNIIIVKDGKIFTPMEFSAIKELSDAINLSAEELEEERIRRIKALDLEETAKEDMLENKTFWVSERMGLPWNVNYFLDGYFYEKEVRKCLGVLERLTILPYFAIVDHLRDGGLMISILGVSRYKSDWKYERIDENGCIYSWVFNTELGNVPDYGMIQITFGMGGVRRIA